MIYNIFYWLHIISALAWLGAFLASLIYAYRAGRAFGSSQEKKYMLRERKAAGIGAHFGAAGILISGWVMAVMPGGPQWGWFNIPLYNWLAIKQVLFIVILILVVFSIKNSVSFKRGLRENKPTISSASRKKWKGA